MSQSHDPRAADLVGTWRLESWALVYEDGREPEYPLGRDANGFILYTADGHVSAILTRDGRRPLVSGSATEKAEAYDGSFAYAGRFQVRDGAVFHAIEVSTNPALVGFTSTRKISLDGDRLTLSGPDFVPNVPRYQRIIWRRSGP
ncbi:MAG TPA: lipocalin-like domain-containing protein [Hyphomicrobiaceae bacterium]|nr:lipocalin-like domain-containing protein [Hyphomicrobiaceae bacterium]